MKRFHIEWSGGDLVKVSFVEMQSSYIFHGYHHATLDCL